MRLLPVVACFLVAGCSCHLDRLWSDGSGTPLVQLAFTSQPQNVVAGSVMQGAVTVAVLDAAGNPAPSFGNAIALSIGANPGGAKLLVAQQGIPANGVVTFDSVRLDKAGSGYTLVAQAVGAVSDTSRSFAVTPGNATHLTFNVQPQTVLAGSPITPAPQVTATDDWGNIATTFNGTITIGIGQNGGTRSPGTLSGSTSAHADQGKASFGGLTIDQDGSGYTLVASFGSGSSVIESAKFDIMARQPSALVFGTGPSTTNKGAVITPPVAVVAVDKTGSPTPTYSGAVTIALDNNPGNATLAGTRTVTAVNGVAQFSDLSIATPASGYTLVATADGLGSVTSDPFTINNFATRLLFVTQPSSANHNQVISPPVILAAVDQAGNLVPTFTGNVNIVIAANPGGPGAHLNGHTSVAAIAGFATFADLSISKGGNNYTLQASASGLSNTTSVQFNIR